MSGFRVFSSNDSRPRVSADPVRRTRINAEVAKDPQKLADALSLMAAQVEELSRKQSQNRDNKTIRFEDRTASGMGQTLTLTHNFGQRVFWRIVGWRSPGGTAAPILIEDESTTDDRLALRSYVSGTVSIEVFT